MRVRDAPRERLHHRARVLSRRDRVAVGGVDDEDALSRCRLQVDVVHTDARSPDHLKLCRMIDQVRGDGRPAADDPPVEVAREGGEFVLGPLEMYLEVDAILGEAVVADRHEVVGDENAGHVWTCGRVDVWTCGRVDVPEGVASACRRQAT